jgi:hypothetical protein
MTPPSEKVTAKDLLAMVAEFSGRVDVLGEIKGDSIPLPGMPATIIRALRLLAACEEVDFRGIMDALRSDGWNNSSQVQRVLGSIAQILEGGEDGR